MISESASQSALQLDEQERHIVAADENLSITLEQLRQERLQVQQLKTQVAACQSRIKSIEQRQVVHPLPPTRVPATWDGPQETVQVNAHRLVTQVQPQFPEQPPGIPSGHQGIGIPPPRFGNEVSEPIPVQQVTPMVVRSHDVSPSLGQSSVGSDPLKYRRKLPSLELNMTKGLTPAQIRKIFEHWIAEISVRIATWGDGAQHYWVETVKRARANHEEWLRKDPAEQAEIEAMFVR